MDNVCAAWNKAFTIRQDPAQVTVNIEDINNILTSSLFKTELEVFLVAFRTLWKRDFLHNPPFEVNVFTILYALFAVFVKKCPTCSDTYDFPPEYDIDTLPTSIDLLLDISLQVLVTFTHLASKNYEQISRNMKK